MLLAVVLAPAAHADGPSGGVCEGGDMEVTVCAADGTVNGGSAGSSGTTTPAGIGGKPSSGSSAPPCTYTRLNPQPAPEHLGKATPPTTGPSTRSSARTPAASAPFVPSGGAAPAPRIDPEVLARRAVDSMRLDGPAVA
ncbi:hypothetical protein ACFVGS_33335, partial [Streptomyces sp. NPDC127114]